MAADATVAKILDGLNESADQARAQVAAIVDALGEQVALDLCDQTIHIEANGGMLASDGSRRRTPTGIFFQLVRPRLSPVQRRAIFEDLPQSVRRGQRPAPAPPIPPRASATHVVQRVDQVMQPPPENPPTAPHTTAPVQKLVLLKEVLPARNNGSSQHGIEPPHATSEEPLDGRPKHRARRAPPRDEHRVVDLDARTEPPSSATTSDDLDAAPAASFEDRVQALVDGFVADLVPLLRESAMSKVRDALGALENRTPDDDVPAVARASTAKRRRGRRRSPVSTRLLDIVRGRPGITLDELALELYGEDGRTPRGQVERASWCGSSRARGGCGARTGSTSWLTEAEAQSLPARMDWARATRVRVTARSQLSREPEFEQ